MGHEKLPNFIFVENVGHEWDTQNYQISFLLKMWDMNGTRKITEFHFC